MSESFACDNNRADTRHPEASTSFYFHHLHRISSVDSSLSIQQQPHRPIVAVVGSPDQSIPPLALLKRVVHDVAALGNVRHVCVEVCGEARQQVTNRNSSTEQEVTRAMSICFRPVRGAQERPQAYTRRGAGMQVLQDKG